MKAVRTALARATGRRCSSSSSSAGAPLPPPLPPLPPLAATSTRLYLARHGETDWNLEARIQGSTCKPLNANGLAQARSLAALLAEAPLELIATSPLRRAARTAEIVRDAHHPRAAWREDGRFAEMHFGEIEGRTLDEYRTTYRETLEQWARGQVDVRWPGEGGESTSDVAERALAGLADLGIPVAGREGATRWRHILLVAHSRVNKTLIASFRGDLSRSSEVQQGNTCLNVFDVGRDGSVQTVLLDYREHVGDTSGAWS